MTLNLKPKASSKPAKLPTPSEHEIQADIVRALRAQGYLVLETTAYRQKGSSGVTKGIPDLLVHAPDAPASELMGLEVKRPGPIKWSCHEQEEAFLNGVFVVVQSVDAALYAVGKFRSLLREGEYHNSDSMDPREIKTRLDTLAVLIEIERASRRATRRRR